MSLAAALPFCPGDWVRRRDDEKIIARVRECRLMAEAPDGVRTIVRYHESGLQMAVLFAEFEPMREVHARPVLRLVAFNPHIPSPRSGSRLTPLERGPVVEAGRMLPALSGAVTPCAQGAASGATFTESSPLQCDDDILQAAIRETIRRHTEKGDA